jgi:hypothetical protein
VLYVYDIIYILVKQNPRNPDLERLLEFRDRN